MTHREKPWEHNQDLTLEEVNLLLKSNFPKLKLNNIKLLGSGWDNTTWLANNEWVFRLPKHMEAATLIQNEINLLPHLTDLDVTIPCPEHICTKPKRYPYPIYGHRYIRGISRARSSKSFKIHSDMIK